MRKTGGISVEGIDKALKELGKLEDKVGKKQIKKIVRKAGKVIEKKAKQNVPVDTGSLKKSIKVKAIAHSADHAYSVVGPSVSGKNVGHHGHLVEFGTRDKNGNQKNKPQPFLKPAVDESADEVQQVMADELKKVLFE
jgi:HK97 gp10 family phage protein